LKIFRFPFSNYNAFAEKIKYCCPENTILGLVRRIVWPGGASSRSRHVFENELSAGWGRQVYQKVFFGPVFSEKYLTIKR